MCTFLFSNRKLKEILILRVVQFLLAAGTDFTNVSVGDFPVKKKTTNNLVYITFVLITSL